MHFSSLGFCTSLHHCFSTILPKFVSEKDTNSSCVPLGHKDLAFKHNVSDMKLKPFIGNSKLSSDFCDLAKATVHVAVHAASKHSA